MQCKSSTYLAHEASLKAVPPGHRSHPPLGAACCMMPPPKYCCTTAGNDVGISKLYTMNCALLLPARPPGLSSRAKCKARRCKTACTQLQSKMKARETTSKKERRAGTSRSGMDTAACTIVLSLRYAITTGQRPTVMNTIG